MEEIVRLNLLNEDNMESKKFSHGFPS